MHVDIWIAIVVAAIGTYAIARSPVAVDSASL